MSNFLWIFPGSSSLIHKFRPKGKSYDWNDRASEQNSPCLKTPSPKPFPTSHMSSTHQPPPQKNGPQQHVQPHQQVDVGSSHMQITSNSRQVSSHMGSSSNMSATGNNPSGRHMTMNTNVSNNSANSNSGLHHSSNNANVAFQSQQHLLKKNIPATIHPVPPKIQQQSLPHPPTNPPSSTAIPPPPPPPAQNCKSLLSAVDHVIMQSLNSNNNNNKTCKHVGNIY
ncbi:unnamed protein product [Orchesella dallaii]|uniref:Uncharacterized protein n=1 Tax=Orchesella dallaii TaxID=48710 RepID=A0ABP1RS65_9HEXA